MRTVDVEALSFAFESTLTEAAKNEESPQTKEIMLETIVFIKEFLSEFPTAANWTPCSVALPEDQSDVLIYFDRCGGEIGIGYYAERADGVKFWCAMGSMLCYNVLAWQPMPEPYRGEA